MKFRRINIFFRNSIGDINGIFWEMFRSNMNNVKTRKLKINGEIKVNIYGDKNYRIEFTEHCLFEIINNKYKYKCRDRDIDHITYNKKLIYRSARSYWEEEENQKDMYNRYIRENEGESEYDEFGVPYYETHSKHYNTFDDTYYSVVDKRFYHLFNKQEVITFDEYETGKIKPVIRSLPDNILIKIFNMCFDAGFNMRLNIILVCKKFEQIVLRSHPPYEENCKGLVQACRQDNVNYYIHWSYLAGSRCSHQKMLIEACKYGSLEIFEYITFRFPYIKLKK